MRTKPNYLCQLIYVKWKNTSFLPIKGFLVRYVRHVNRTPFIINKINIKLFILYFDYDINIQNFEKYWIISE